MSDMPPLTSSEMSSWLSCQRGWWLRYYRRLRRTNDYASLPTVGDIYHDGLEAYYNGEDVDPTESVRKKSLELMERLPEYGERISKDAELASIMLEGYFQWVTETGADEGLRIIGAEQVVQAKVGQYVLRGKIDARLEREADGAKLQLEHKTVGNLSDIPSYAQSGTQFLNYNLLAYLNELEADEPTRTDGILLNMARRVKRTKTAKPPFYGRYEVRHNLDELRNQYKHVIAVGDQILQARIMLDEGTEHHLVVPPNVDRNHQWKCACKEVTAMFDDGTDVEQFLAEFYEEHDPNARYEEAVAE